MARPPVSREDRWRRAARAAQRAEREHQRALKAPDAETQHLHELAARELRSLAWRELNLGLDEPSWPDGQERLPLDVQALAVAVIAQEPMSPSWRHVVERRLEQILQIYEVEVAE